MSFRSWFHLHKLGLGISALATASPALAAGLPLDAASFPDPNSLITPQMANAITKTVGLGTDHRSYEGPTALGMLLGLDIGIEATVAVIPKDFGAALKDAGLSTATPPFLPVPRLHLHKGIGPRLGLNASYVGVGQLKVYGGDIKLTVSQPEEGPTIALRVAYTKAEIGFIETTTWTPQVVFGRRLDFAEPYFGMGYQTSTGKIKIPIEVFGQSITISGTGKARGFLGFTGVQFNTPIGLQLTVEGSYSSAGVHTIGTKIGIGL